MKKITKNIKMDDDEKKILDFFNKGEWRSVHNFEEQKNIARAAAKNTMNRNLLPLKNEFGQRT